MPENDNGPTYSFAVCGQCKSICCQDAKPPLSRKRKKIIQEYLKKQKINVSEPFAKNYYSYPAIDEELYCRLFSRQTGKCIVHPVKPETCVGGPITFDINFKTKKVEWFLKTSDLCAYAGSLFKNKSAFEEHFEVAKEQIINLIKQLSAEELRAIVNIDEPQTFKIGEDNLPLEVAKKLGL